MSDPEISLFQTASEDSVCSFLDLFAKGTWQDVFEFLRELQGPEKFIAFEGCELKVNREDKTLFSASLNVAQWFAPK